MSVRSELVPLLGLTLTPLTWACVPDAFRSVPEPVGTTLAPFRWLRFHELGCECVDSPPRVNTQQSLTRPWDIRVTRLGHTVIICVRGEFILSRRPLPGGRLAVAWFEKVDVPVCVLCVGGGGSHPSGGHKEKIPGV
jgi:hypothetical protein